MVLNMIELFSLREQEIFNILKELNNLNFVVIGGYAVNAYTLPRFSVDCDIIIKNKEQLVDIEKIIRRSDYVKEDHAKLNLPYHENFVRYEKKIKKDFLVSLDILIGQVLDRRTGASFSADWIFEHSSKMQLRGKTILESIEILVPDIHALVAMKIISCRINDIRDIFMLMPNVKNKKELKSEISQRINFNEVLKIIDKEINSEKFRNSLQGVFGYIDDKLFEKHKKTVLEFSEEEK